ncbi:MAG: U32 family peptidase, partial [Methanomicrobiales archaeon]|nr:U32 family peptidase [Methanomicrobiales archaeon]
GCLCDGPGRIMGRDAPDHRGILVGIIEILDPGSGSIGVRLTGSAIPEKGDGLVFRTPGRDDEETGMVLRQDPVIDARILWLKAEPGTRSSVREGAGLFITRRARQDEALRCYSPGTTTPRWPRVRIDLALRVGEDGTPVLEGSVVRNGVPVTFLRREGGFAVEPARAQELPAAGVEEILSRRGDAPYLIGSVRVEWPAGSYARKGDLGGLRRDLLAEAERFLAMSGMPGPGELSRARERLGRALLEETPASLPGETMPVLVILTDTPEAVAGIVEEGSGCPALEPAPRHGPSPGKTGDPAPWTEAGSMVLEAAAMAAGTGRGLLWKWPRITGDPWIAGSPGVLQDAGMAGLSGLMVDGAGAAVAARAAFPGLAIHGGPGLNAWNARTVRILSPLCSSITLSPELSLQDLRELVPRARRAGDTPSLGFLVEGNLEVMTSEDRLTGLLPEGRGQDRGRQFIGLQDATSRIFAVTTDICGRTRIANSVETCLIDQLPALLSLGIRDILIDARGRGPRYAREMAALYREALSAIEKGVDGIPRRLEELGEECRKIARGGITHGAFLRGLREEDG